MKETKFLGKGLLIPNLNKSDGMRAFMGVGALSQMVNLTKTEPPLIFTGYENMVGSKNECFEKTEVDYRIERIIEKSQYYKDYILKNLETDEIRLFKRREAINITESYGYTMTYNIDNYKEGDIIKKGTIIKSTASYDDAGNFGFGVNLNILSIPYKGLTYEDACVISESAAKKLTHQYVHKIDITLNTNDILLNLYTDEDGEYKCFPDIGEECNGILAVRRKINFENFKRLSNTSLKEIDNLTDDIFYSKGRVVDIKIFSNVKNLEKIENFKFNKQIIKYLKKEEEFYNNISTYRNCSENDLTLQSELVKASKFEQHNYFYMSKNFDSFVMRFYVVEDVPIKIGSKLTNLVGCKGIVSKILPDSEMPKVVGSNINIELIMNPLAIVNRLIPSVLYERELNFIMQRLVDYLVKYQSNSSNRNKLIFISNTITKLINDKYGNFLKDKFTNYSDLEIDSEWNNIIENGFPIHQSPFNNNISFENMKNLYNFMKKIYSQQNDDLMYQIEIDGIPVASKMVVGKSYIIKLKHETKTKVSARSFSNINNKEIPSKSKKINNHQSQYSNNPVRLGELLAEYKSF